MAIVIDGSTKYVVNIGCDLGQMHDPTAVVVADLERRDREIHYIIRYLKRFPLGTPYPEIVEGIRQIYDNIPEPGGYVTQDGQRWKIQLDKQIWADATGVGKPIVDMLTKELPKADYYGKIHAVFITGGTGTENFKVGDREIRLPKVHLVAKLQALFSYNRIHLPNNREALVMKEELMNYQIRVTESANTQFGAFKVGSHDDLVTALGLACLSEGDWGFMTY